MKSLDTSLIEFDLRGRDGEREGERGRQTDRDAQERMRKNFRNAHSPHYVSEIAVLLWLFYCDPGAQHEMWIRHFFNPLLLWFKENKEEMQRND